MPRLRRLALLALVLAVPSGAALAAPGASKQLRISVRGGKAVGGPQRFSAGKDEVVVLVVSADVEDEVHLHGYDRMKDVTPRKWAWLWVRTSITGRFEIELEDRSLEIGELTVK